MIESPAVALVATGAVALAITLALVPLLRLVALRVGLVDRPDGRRKLQTRAVPKAGGLAVLCATVLTLALIAAFRPEVVAALSGDARFWSLFVAASFIGLVGLADDFRGLRGRHKLVGQLIAVSILIFPGGLYVGSVRLFGLEVELGALGLAFTAFWLLGCINALNLIDGMDGLLGIVAAIVCLTLAVVGALTGKWLVAVVAATMAGSLLGFLVFNLPPARVYLGDCGSMVIGLVVGAISIESSFKGPTAAALAAPAALLIIPILDTGAALVRRVLTGRSIYTTDRGHVHHCLLRRGMSRGAVLAVVGGLSLVAAGGGVLSYVFGTDQFALVGAAAVTATLLLTRWFGTGEVRLLIERGRAVLAAFQHGQTADRSHALEVHLQGNAAWNEVWLRLTEAAEGLRLRALRMDVNLPAIHEGYHARWQRFGAAGEADRCWRAEVPLFMGEQVIGRLTAVGCRDGGSAWFKLARLAAIVDQAEREATTLAAGNRLPALNTSPVALQSIA
jgi:UDP-GlcNAc:undecaprenyl-phosphate GlcNAc-1-phosphate transferase